MLSDKIYTQIERVVDHLAEMELEPEESMWNYEGLVKALQTLHIVYLQQKEDEAYNCGNWG